MRKMSILLMAVVLIIGMSVGVMADTTANVDVTINTDSYMSIDIVTDLFAVNGLFGNSPLSGQPGLYVSDGNVTVDYTKNVAAGLWGIDKNIMGDSLLTVNDDNVEVVMVDTNTDAVVTLEWLSSTNWPDKGLNALVRTSTHEDIPDPNHAYVGDPTNSLREYTASLASGIGTAWRDDSRDAQVHALGESDTFDVDAAQCQGPYLYHLNGAIFLGKADAVLANQDTSFTLQLTVAEM